MRVKTEIYRTHTVELTDAEMLYIKMLTQNMLTEESMTEKDIREGIFQAASEATKKV